MQSFHTENLVISALKYVQDALLVKRQTICLVNKPNNFK